MFIVTHEPQFTHSVTVRVPVDGGYEDQKCKATFRVLPVEEAGAFDLTDGAASTAFLRRVVVSMDELEGPDKQPVQWNDGVRDGLFSLPYVRSALTRTYFAAVGGARLGN